MKKTVRFWALLALFAAWIPLRFPVLAQTAGPTNNTSGLILWWPLDEGSGATTADASGNGSTGTLNNAAGWTVPGQITNGVSLNTSSSQFVAANGSTSAMNGSAGGTLTGWVQTSSGFTFGFNDTAGQRFSIECSGGHVYWCVENGAVSYPSCTFLPDTNWHWFALTYAPAGFSDLSNITVYIDGVSQALVPGGSPPSATLSSSLGTFTVGRSLANSVYYSMGADDIRLYNRALSAVEVSNLFQWPTGGRYMPSPRQLSGSQTYYIDYNNGSDANNGLSTNAPWQNQPFMPNFTGSYTHHAGDWFIFRGGTIWPSNCFPTVLGAGGLQGLADNYGVNSNWFAGPAFTRPVFDGGHQASLLIYVGPGIRYVNFNSIEMRAITCSVAFNQGLLCFGDTDNLTGTNLWLHDWLLNPSITSDDAHGGFIGNFNGGYGITNIILDHCEISNLENTNYWNGVCVRLAGVLNYCTVHDNSSAILYAQDVNHCTIYNICTPYSGFDPTYHFNGYYMDNGNGNGNAAGVNIYLRNSFFHDVGGGANMAFPNVEKEDSYVYNNVLYGSMSAQLAVAVDPYDYGGTGVVGSVYVYNNTIVNFISNVCAVHIVSRPQLQVSNVWVYNNHIIGLGASVTDANSGTAVNVVVANNLVQAPADAAAAGYTLANLYAPTASSSPTVGGGTGSVVSALFANDVTNNFRTPTAWDIGAYQWYVPLTPPSNLRVASTAQ